MTDRENELVSKLSVIVARECGIPPAIVKQLRIAAALHDVGKKKVPASIVGKPGKLDPAEFEVMKTHTTHGVEMLSSLQGDLGTLVRNVCLYHHEWHDGSGSYWGKRSDELPFYVSIVSICDVFCALTSERCYKHAWPPEDALAYVQGKSGTQFSPMLVDAFIWLMRHDPKVKSLFTKSR